VITGLRAWPFLFLEELFKHASGQRWLKEREARVAVSEFVSERAEEPTKGAAAASQEQIIARAIREALKLPSDAELTGEVMQKVTSLDLSSEPITDEGVSLLARPDTELKNLSTLDLFGTQVTDAGVKELARADTGLKKLSMLGLSSTKVTDAAVKDLRKARPKLGIFYRLKAMPGHFVSRAAGG